MGTVQAMFTWSKKYLVKAAAPAAVLARAAAGMLGSVVGPAVVVGEADVVVGAGVLVVGEGAVVVVVLEGDASGLASPPHPASSIDAARGTASSPTEVLFTVPPTVLRAEHGQIDARRFFG